jgi:hypothetical protein
MIGLVPAGERSFSYWLSSMDAWFSSVLDWSVSDPVIGLAGIRERPRLLGGECSIKSEFGKGTCVRVVLPILEFDSEAALHTGGDSCI